MNWPLIVGIIGTLISAGLFFVPGLTFWKIYTSKSVGGFQPYPYLVTLLSCIVWLLYGILLPNDRVLVIAVNSTGIVFELLWVSIFFIYTDTRGRKIVVSVVIGIAVSCTALGLTVFLGVAKKSHVLGLAGALTSLLMYAAPLTVVIKVITSKSVKYMPFFLSVVIFLNGLCWSVYALLVSDRYILLSNGIGSCLCLIQLILYAYYWKYGVHDGDGDGDGVGVGVGVDGEGGGDEGEGGDTIEHP